MQSCCVPGCETYKNIQTLNIKYFKFPLHNQALLKKWLEKIGKPNWKPSLQDQICSAHFKKTDIDNHPSWKYPRLKPLVVPSIFPQKPVISHLLIKQNSSQIPILKYQTTEPSNPQVMNLVPVGIIQLNQVTVIPVDTQNLTVSRPILKLVPMTQTQLQEISVKSDSNTAKKNTNVQIEDITDKAESVSQSKRITHKRTKSITNTQNSNTTNTQNKNVTKILVEDISQQPETIPDIQSNEIKCIKKVAKDTEVKANETKCIKGSNKITEKDKDSKVIIKRPILKISIHKMYNRPTKQNEFLDITSTENVKELNNTDSVCSPKAMQNSTQKSSNLKRTNKDISKDSDTQREDTSDGKMDVYSLSKKVQCLYNKFEHEYSSIQKHMQLLKQKHKREQDEIKRLQDTLSTLLENSKKHLCKQNLDINVKRRRMSVMVDDSKDEEEFEKLLREVRELKKTVLNSRMEANSSIEHANPFKTTALNNVDSVREMDEDDSGSFEEVDDFADNTFGSNTEYCSEEYLEPDIGDK